MLTFSFDLPERTEPEPGKGQSEAERDRNPTCSRVSGSIFHIFADGGGGAENCHRQKHGAGHLQPQLMRGAAERPCRGAGPAHHRTDGAAASGLLPGYARDGAQLS